MLVVKNIFEQEIPVWAIDFESYYCTKTKYSLSAKGMTTVQYIRDLRFKAHGCSYVSPEGESGWVTHKDLPEFFGSINWDQSAMLCHNTQFDGLIAYEIYGIKANYYLDTMCMANGEFGPGVKNRLTDIVKRLGIERDKLSGELEKTDGIRDLSKEQEEALIPYAIRDSDITREAFEKFYFDLGYPEKELHVIDVTLKTFVNPKLEIDAAICRAEIEEEDIRMKNLFESDLIKGANLSQACIVKLLDKGIEGLLRSRECFAELLRSRGINPPMKNKIAKNGDVLNELTYAFAKNDAELIALGEDPRVSDLVAAWTGMKSTIRKTRAQRFLDVTNNGTKTLPMPLRYCGGRTHRWSGGGSDKDGGSNPWNPQNLNSGRDGRGSRLRDAIIAPKGWRVLVCDSSQGECRTHAWIWEDDELLETFASGGDPYSKLASEIFKVHVSKTENYHLRFVGKEGELSLGFGVGAKKFYNTIQTKYGLDSSQFSFEDAEKVVQYYRQKRANIVAGWRQLSNFLALMASKSLTGQDFKLFRFYNDKIYMPNGLPIVYRDLHWHFDKEKQEGNYIYRFKEDWVKLYGAKLGENITQSVHRTIVAEQALEISKELPIVLLVHDEVVALAPEREADDAVKFMVTEMSRSPSWCSDLPMASEGKHSRCYSK